MLYPLTFKPIFKERVWGGRNLESLYGKPLPPGVGVGESWEISDRPETASVITNGPLAGQDLRWLIEHHAKELLGEAPSVRGRFPLLVKILDAQAALSLQVHPPAGMAERLVGESKTEMWFITQATPGAEVYLGLKRGVSRDLFERKLKDGAVSECVHRLKVQAGDAVFLPGGRLHAIGPGIVLFEIQENSDTTYRLFDWNRCGLDGNPRDLHVAQAMACIDFNDFEPGLIRNRFDSRPGLQTRCLVKDARFTVELGQITPLAAGSGAAANETGGANLIANQGAENAPGPMVIGVVSGQLVLRDDSHELRLFPGQFCLAPACRERVTLGTPAHTMFLLVRLGTGARSNGC